MVNPRQCTRRPQAGTSLIEALIALLVMGFGMLTVLGMQGRLRQGGDAALLRAEAVRIAQAEMERLRAFQALTRHQALPAEALVFDEIGNDSRSIRGSAAEFQLSRVVTPLDGSGLELHLAVQWDDRSSETGELVLDWRSALAATDPRLTLSALLPPDQGVAQARALDRHPAIPAQARLLGPRSLLQPSTAERRVLVFDNRSGRVTGLCDTSGKPSVNELTEADLSACADTLVGGAYLLSGHVRFSLGPTPDPVAPNDPVMPVGVAVELSSSPHPGPAHCHTDSTRHRLAGRQVVEYHCLIPPREPSQADPSPGWSGRSRLTGLDLGPTGVRVCRYSDDLDGNGQIDNAEHGGHYQRLAQSLGQQNFLVIRHGASCPPGRRVDLAAQVFRSSVTVNHQP